MRARPLVAAGLVTLAFGALGCGAAFKLPNEISRGRSIPSDQSYQVVATWSSYVDELGQTHPDMAGVSDILLLSQGTGAQLFILFNTGGSGIGTRGKLNLFPLTRPNAIPGIVFPTLFNPVALASGANHLFVLDQGDTTIARDPSNSEIRDLSAYWRVREFGLLGGDTLSTFTDTTVAFVRGVASDAQGRVYVSGIAIIRVPDQTDPRIITRTFQSRIYRYIRGQRYPGITPPDRNMPGADWHRDSTWVVEEGSGVGTVQNPYAVYWSPAGGPALYVVDAGKNWIQKLYDDVVSTGFYFLDGGQTSVTFSAPEDVTVDSRGFLYIADTGNRRALRYAPDGTFVQKINVEGDTLSAPRVVAADDSIAYLGFQSPANKVVRYKRRP